MAERKSLKGALVGRPSDYRPEFDEIAYKLCLLNATDTEIADILGVNADTIHSWKSKHPSFAESIARAKTLADANVAERLYQRAMGYSHPEDHISTYQGEVTITPTTRHYPPDTQAASLWLRNRQPGRWREKTDQEISGPGGGAVRIEHSVDLSKLSGDDLDALEVLARKLHGGADDGAR